MSVACAPGSQPIINQKPGFVQHRSCRMREFTIQLHSLQDVQEFVNIACTCPFQVTVGNESQRIDGKDFMGMFSLDYRFPQKVWVDCSQEELQAFLQRLQAFLPN